MSRGIADLIGDSVKLKIMNLDYTEENGRPIIHVLGRDGNDKFHHIEVEGHYPSFYIHEDEYTSRIGNHYAVRNVEFGYEGLHGEPLVRIETFLPKHVSEMRDLFERTWESDIWYTQVWLLDHGIMTGVEIDLSSASGGRVGDKRVHDDAVSACEPPSTKPRTVIVDIEVASEAGVPEPTKAEWPVSTIVAYDSYTDTYAGWILHHDDHDLDRWHDEDIDLDRFSVFEDESAMLNDFNEWVSEHQPDILTGWYSNDFDFPYLVTRCRKLNTWSFQDWSPLGETYISKRWGDPVTKGVSMIDMLDAYQKTRIHKLPNKSLDYVAGEEVDHEKVELPHSHTDMWRLMPVEFMRYNKRDVELVEQIEREKGLIELLIHMREVTGAEFTDFEFNIVMIGMLTLHKARDRGIRLPTAVKPDVDWFHGAVVLDSVAGLHEHVVYLDFSSLYPSMMLLCNMSPETLIGNEAELEASDYDKEDCFVSFHDPRPENVKEGDDPVFEPVYFANTYHRGLMASLVDDMIGLKEEYRSKGRKMYEAVKRVTNSIWGVSGDKDSFGRGWRLFDVRMAEAITLGGRKTLMFGSEKAIEWLHANGYSDARIVVGDTDGFGITIPSADSRSEAVEAAEKAAEYVNEQLPAFERETFNSDREALEIECESYAERLFIQLGKGEPIGSDVGTKKKYAEKVTWTDSKGVLDEPDMIVKGFAYVRSDRSPISKRAQKLVFDELMENDVETARENVFEWLEEQIKAIAHGEMNEEIGIPFGIGQKLEQYGRSDRTPQPQYRGAKYANEFIYEGSAINQGDKPVYYYIKEGRTGGLRKTYKADTAEDGRYVDAVSVLDPGDLPNGMQVDYPKMIEKTLQDQLKRIFRTLQWDFPWDRIVEQHMPPEHFREEDAMGLEEFM